MDKIEQLKREIKELEKQQYEQEQQDLQKRKDAVTPVIEYYITPEEAHTSMWQKVYEGDTFWRVYAECLNKKEAEEAGHSLFLGGIGYRITDDYFSREGGGNRHLEECNPEVRKAVREFIKEHPEGGNITDIVLKFKTNN